MNLLSKISILTVLAVSSFANAADFREAATICSTMSFDSAKNTCVASARANQNEYFDSAAINVCKSMSFDSGKNECINNIAGKSYEGFEISNCASQSFDSGKNSCLTSNGQRVSNNTYPQPLPPPPQHYPPQNPNYPSQDYVIGRTVSWENAGIFTAPKGISESFSMSFNSGRAISEVRLATQGSSVRILRAYAVTASGQHIDLPGFVGDIGRGATKTNRLDSRYAVRVNELVLEVISTQLIGSRGKLEVVVGLTR